MRAHFHVLMFPYHGAAAKRLPEVFVQDVPRESPLQNLLEEVEIVAIPGIGFGKLGEGYLRFALTVDTPGIALVVERLAGPRW